MAMIKWPNDVLVEGRKIAGILVVTKASPGERTLCLICGIGLNVNDGPSRLPDTATSLAIASGKTHALDDVLSALLDNLTNTMNRFEARDTDELWRHVELRLAFRGEMVRVEDGHRTHRGILRGVTSAGLLTLQLPSEETVSVAAGDLTRGPVMMP